MKHWVGHIRGTGYTALNILHMKHRGGSGVDFTNLVLILHLSLILMGLSVNSKKTIQVSHMTITRSGDAVLAALQGRLSHNLVLASSLQLEH